MAQLVLGVVGAVGGFFVGGPAGAQAGFAIGSAIGASYEASKVKTYGPRLEDLKVSGTDYGQAIPWIQGAPRMAASYWWSSDRREIATSESQGKGGGPTVTTYTYEIDALLGLTDGEIDGVTRIWWNGKLVWTNLADADEQSRIDSESSVYWTRLTVYTGRADQLPDPTYEAAVGSSDAPAYRGRGAVFIQGMKLGNSGQLPNLTFEVSSSLSSSDDMTRRTALPDSGYSFTPGGLGRPAILAMRPNVRVGLVSTSNSGVYEFDLSGNYLGLSSRTGANEAYPGPMVGIVHIPVGIIDESAVRWQNFSTVTGVPAHKLLPVGTLDGSGSEIVEGDDLSAVLPAGEYVGAIAMCSDRLHAVIMTAPVLAMGGGSVIDKWYLVRRFDGETTLLRSGTIAAPMTTVLTGSGNSTSVDSYGIYGCCMLEDDLQHLWVAYGAGNGPVSMHSLDDDGVLRLKATLQSNQGLLVYNFTAPTIWAEAGFCVAISARSFQTFARAGSTIQPVNLADAVEALCLRAGLSAQHFDVSALASNPKPVRALAASVVGPVRPVLEQLQAAYFFEACLSDKLYFRPRASEPVATIPFADLATGSDGPQEQPLELLLNSDLEVPAQVAIQYPNVEDDHQTGTEYSDRLLTGQASLNTVQLALGFTPAEAKGIADAIVADSAASLVTTEIALPLAYAHLEATDVVTVIDEAGEPLRLRLTNKKDERGVLSFSAVLDDAQAVESAQITDETYAPSGTVRTVASTVLHALDIPLLRDADDTPGFYVAARGATGNWPGAQVLGSSNDIDYALAATVAESAVFGTCTTVLGDWTGGMVMDEINSVTVTLAHGELSSLTREALLEAATENTLLVGAEVIRFATATLLSAEPNVYKLTRLIRGQRGTEWAMTGHGTDERAVLLRPQGLRRVLQQASEVGQLRYLKPVTLGLSAATVQPQQFTPQGVSAKPFAPVHVRLQADINAGAVVISWMRRTRLSTRLLSAQGMNAPLGEQAEAYEIDVFSDAGRTTLLRTIVTDTSTATYSAADQSADLGTLASALYVTVYQISALVGRGYGSNGSITGISYAARRAVVYDDEASLVQSFLDTRVDGAIIYKGFTPPGLGEPNTWLLGDASNNAVEINTSSVGWKQIATGSTDRIRINDIGIALNASVGYRNAYGNVAAFLPAQAGVFERVEWTGNGAGARSIVHSMGTAPALMLVKSNGAAKWWMYSAQAGAGLSMRFPEATLAGDVFSADPNAFPSLSTTTHLEVGSDLNASGVQYLAMVFSGDSASVEVGTYSGNGTGAGPAQVLGFKPEILLVRNIDGSAARTFITLAALEGTAVSHWFIDDAGTSAADAAIVTLSSTGFQATSSDLSVNESGTTYQYWGTQTMTMQQLAAAQTSAEVPINENFQTLEWASIFGRRHAVTTGLTWGYYGGIWGGLTVADGSVTLTNAASNYVVVERSTGVVSTSTATTNWLDVAKYARVYKLTTAGNVVTAVEDHRAGLYGVHGMWLPERRVESVSAAYAFVMADMQATKLHPSADTTARTWTIPANASVAFPIGAELELINQNAGGVITVAITSDTLRLAGAGTTGSRSLAANGWARAKKLTATEWIIRGEGLT